MPNFSRISRERLATCHPDLQRLMNEAVKDSAVDFTIVCGRRGKEDQEKAFREGKSKLHYPKSRHNSNPSEAVDVAPYVNGKLNWNPDYFRPLALHIKETAQRLGIAIRWGGDWDRGFIDMPHFELARKEKANG